MEQHLAEGKKRTRNCAILDKTEQGKGLAEPPKQLFHPDSL